MSWENVLFGRRKTLLSNALESVSWRPQRNYGGGIPILQVDLSVAGGEKRCHGKLIPDFDCCGLNSFSPLIGQGLSAAGALIDTVLVK